MNSSKIWIVITGIVVIVSGFLMYTMDRSRKAEKVSFVSKIQELSVRIAELEHTKLELEQTKKEKAASEAKFQSDLAAMESQVDELKKSGAVWRSKVEALSKEKDSLNKYIQNNNTVVAKLNKKISALEKERDEALRKASQEPDGVARPLFSGLMNDPQADDASFDDPATAMGAKLAQEEIVDLGRIILHPDTNQAARVEHVNSLYGFVVLSAGTKDGLRKDAVINITRNNRLIAKAVVKKAREDASSAVTLPEWTREEIRIGDLISVNSPSPGLAR